MFSHRDRGTLSIWRASQEISPSGNDLNEKDQLGQRKEGQKSISDKISGD